MTNQEVMKMMIDMGLHEGGIGSWEFNNDWYKFANRVAEKEREACAKIAENRDSTGFPCIGVAEQIRARGQAFEAKLKEKNT